MTRKPTKPAKPAKGRQPMRKRYGDGRLRRGKVKAKELFDTKPVPSEQRCIARRKSCPNCGHRYERGDKTWQCPECATERRCRNKAAYGTMVCRYHGGGSARQAKERNERKYHVAHQIAAAYDRIIGDPELLSLTQEIGLVSARLDELFGMVDRYDNSGAHKEITEVLQGMENTVYQMKSLMGKDASVPIDNLQLFAVRLKKVLEPVNIEMRLWDVISDNMELLRRLNETERKWIVSNEGMVPVIFVLEILARIQRLTMKYIRNPEDRIAFSREYSSQMPISIAPPADSKAA